MRRSACLVAVLALVAGCAISPTAPKPAVAVAAYSSRTAEHLLAALARMSAMDGTALAAEIVKTREAAERVPSDFARVEAAMALSMAAVPDEAQILALVAPVVAAKPPAEPELRAMAWFLHGMAIDRRKLRDGLAAASAKTREERREAQSQRLRAETQQERADRLQQKLEALTDLEKSLANRNHADDTDHRPR